MRWLPWCLLAVLGAVYVCVAFSPYGAVFHDDGLYLVTAGSLASGQGYGITSTPVEIPQTKYPILYPALLAAVWRAAGGYPANVAAFKLLSLCFAAGWMGAVFVLCRRMGLDPTQAAWICVATLCGRWPLFLLTAVLPDSLFCLLSTLALLHLTRADAARGWIWPLVAGVECGAAFLTRTVGAVLIIAAFVTLLLAHRRRQAILFGAVAVLLCAPWVMWQHSQPVPAGVLGYYSKASYENGSVLSVPGISSKAAALGLNAAMIAGGFQVLVNAPVSWAGWPLGLMCTAVLLWRVRAEFHRISLPAFWLTGIGFVLLLWLGPPFRYLLPGLPVAAAFVLSEMLRLKPPWRAAALATLAVTLSVAAFANSFQAIRSIRAGKPVSFAGQDLDNPAAMERLFDWIRHNTSARAVIAANNDPLVYLETGRKSIRLFGLHNYGLLYAHQGGAGTADEFREHLLRYRIRYLVLTPMTGFNEAVPFREVFETVRNRDPDAFAVRYVDRDPAYTIVETRLDALGLRYAGLLCR